MSNFTTIVAAHIAELATAGSMILPSAPVAQKLSFVDVISSLTTNVSDDITSLTLVV